MPNECLSPQGTRGGLVARELPVRTAVAGICSGDFHDRWEQSRQVTDLGDLVQDDLLALLQNDESDWETRWFVARALGGFDHPDVIAALFNTFATTPDDDLRQAVAAALTQIGAAAIAALGHLMAQPTLRPVAVQALARIQHPDTLPLLLEATTDLRPSVRATALDALSAFVDPAILPAVEQGLDDASPIVRAAAIRGLLGLRSLLRPTQLIDTLTPKLWDSDLAVAQKAIYGLGRLQIPAAAVPLLKRLQTEPSEALQTYLVQALTWQNTVAALDGLAEAWSSLSQPVRLATVQGLGTVAPALAPQAAAALSHWLQALPATPVHGILRSHLVLALGHLGRPERVPQLQSLCQDPDPVVQLHAEAALRQSQSTP
ncbi:MAG: HEAT repeat domain-containing protein [Cyanobacteria bacterium J06638_6]